MFDRLIHRPTILAAALVLLSTTVCLAADAGGEHGTGSIKEDLPFWGIVAFVGFLLAIKFLGWDSLTSGMKEREETENQLIGEAEGLRNEAADQLRQQQGRMEALDEHVREVLAEAERDADHTRKDIHSVAENEAQLAHHRAEMEINRVKAQSLNDLFATAAERVAEQAEQRIKEKFSAADQEKLIDEAVTEFVTQNA